jgi:hypothetical protein
VVKCPRAVRRGKKSGEVARHAPPALGLAVAATLATLTSPVFAAPPDVAGVTAAPTRERGGPPLLRLELSFRWLDVPAGRWNLEQSSFGAGVVLQPARWIALRSALETSATEIYARKLEAEPFQVRARLDAQSRWGLSHALSVRTHRFGPARLEAFGEMRWMPGTSALRILQLILMPNGLDLRDYGRLDQLARARFAWWQASMGARFGVSAGRVDAFVDAGALWVRIGLRYALRERALALGRLVAPDTEIDADGRFTIEEGQPFARAGLRLDLPGPFGLSGTGTAVPTKHGIAHGITFAATWAP